MLSLYIVLSKHSVYLASLQIKSLFIAFDTSRCEPDVVADVCVKHT